MFADDTPPRRTKKIWPLIVIFLIVIAALGGTGFVLTMKIKFADFKPPMAPANVVITKAAPLLFEDKIEAIGTTQANESTDLTATVIETVKSISVGEGEFVSAGTVLAQLTDDEEQATLDEATRAYIRYNKLTSNKLGSIAQRDEAKAAMDIAKAKLGERKIVAPFDGVVGLRHVSVGDLVSPGTLITTIDDIDPVKVDFAVPETYLSAIKAGLTVKARTAAYQDKDFEGTIYAVDSRVDPDTRSISARATIPNGDHLLRPGMLMNVTIVKSSQSLLAIPEEAIMSAGERHFVYTVTPESKIEEKTVTTGLREPGYVAVLSGLNEGDQVVIEGQMKTGAGAPVNIADEKSTADATAAALKFSVTRKKEAIENKSEKAE
ncbi:MAG TPA: efflux RND transporter periplasmic adaptor subunit [Alphaproteobacteria bacterium]|nr:efflux RND transporter periplasmic adaptor subunit [Alphaproteobacteria bacterium]HNS43597.1 efflux RND transporter periplasmic adaptor subunit [Alphaproteobacteria bacterium]